MGPRDGDLTSLHDLLARLRSGDQLGLAKDTGEAAPRRTPAPRAPAPPRPARRAPRAPAHPARRAAARGDGV